MEADGEAGGVKICGAPASQSFSMESRVPVGKCEKMCASRAAFGRDRKFSLHLCVKVTVLTFGIVNYIGSITIDLFMWVVEALT